MNENTEAASAAAAQTAAPEIDQSTAAAGASYASGGFIGASKAEGAPIVSTGYVVNVVDHAEAAARAWYAEHYHAAQLAGRTPITSTELSRLVSLVRAAASITSKE